VMAQDPAAVGRLAARRLFERMSGDQSPPAIHTLPTRLLVRGSGELPPTVESEAADVGAESGVFEAGAAGS